MLHDTTRRPRTLLDLTQGLPVLTKVPHQRSRLLQPCRYTPHSSLTALLLLSKKVSPRSGLGSIELPRQSHNLKQTSQSNWKHSDLSPKVHPTLSLFPSRVASSVIGGSGTDCLTLVREMSRKQELPPSFIFSNMERTKAQKKSFFEIVSQFGR